MLYSSYLGQEPDQGAGQLAVGVGVIERHGLPGVSTVAGPPDAADILIDVVGEVKVHHMLNIWDI